LTRRTIVEPEHSPGVAWKGFHVTLTSCNGSGKGFHGPLTPVNIPGKGFPEPLPTSHDPWKRDCAAQDENGERPAYFTSSTGQRATMAMR